MRQALTHQDIEPAVKGGAVFACGGGGFADHGRMLGTAAVNAGVPELVSVDELSPEDIVATAAAIGAPGGRTPWEMRGVDYVRAVDLVEEALGKPVAALMIGQNGKSSTLNAWLPSAMKGLKVLDAVGDIRAHPTGDMGSIGLAGSPQPMIQAAAGGNRQNGAYMELVVRGATGKVSPVLRTAGDMAGGFIASCRNPIPASYVAEHAALGGVSSALSLGRAILDAEPKGGPAVIDAILSQTRGTIIAQGKVTDVAIAYTNEAFDVGTITVDGGSGPVTIHCMNEYMAVDGADGSRLGTWPDVITTLSPAGIPLSNNEIDKGDEIAVLHIHKRHLPLSSVVNDPAVYPPVEKALGIALASFAMAPA
ncbi:MAG: DUF917 domain-containing protein [Pseudomonadota bacterium]